MQSDNDYTSALEPTTQADGSLLAGDDQQETTLQWLLDQDYAEPSDKVFAVSEDELQQSELTQYESELANRPMFAGKPGPDDFSSFLGEEIVMTSADQGADIYALPGEPMTDTLENSGANRGEAMAIDHRRSPLRQSECSNRELDEGSDILGLNEEDDIGERFLVLQKARIEAIEAIEATEATEVRDSAPAHTNELEQASHAATGFLSDPATFAGGFPEADEVPVAAFEAREPELPDTTEGFLGVAVELIEPAGNLLLDEPEIVADVTSEPSIEIDPDVPICEERTQVSIENTFSRDEFLEGGESFDVFDYVAANEPPVDEEDFDEYLLRGEHLEERDSGVEELSVEKTRGIASVDPQLETSIDYHEDFTATDDFDSAAITAITAAIGQIMEELSVAVASRLSELSLDADSVQVELMLGTDEDSIAQCRSRNYLPILDIGTDIPTALSTLGQLEIDTIYVRLVAGDEFECWNTLFAADFTPPGAVDLDDFSAFDDFASFDDLVPPKEDDEPFGLAFDEGIFDTDISEELVESFAEVLDDDIANLSVTEDVVPVTDSIEAEQLVTPDNEAQVEGSIFDDDIFGADLAEDFADTQELSSADVEALIDSLADSDTDIGEICGVAVDEFSEGGSGELTSLPTPSKSPAQQADNDKVPAKAAHTDMSWCIPADIKFSYTSKSVSEVFTDFLDAFIEEGASELEKLEDAMGEWEKDIVDEVAYAPIPRILHTLKGIAKSVGLQRYGTLIHNFETLLDAFPRPDAGAQSAYFLVVHAWLDASVRGFESIERERADIDSELPCDIASPVIGAAVEVNPPAASAQPTPQAERVFAPQELELVVQEERNKDKKLAEEGAKVLAAQQTIRMTPETIDRLLSLNNEAQQLGVRSSQSTVKSKRAATELLARLSLVRAHVAKIADKAFLNVTSKGGVASSAMDALEMDQYSELQEAADILREGVEDLDDLIRVSSRQNTVAEALLKQQASVISSLGSSIQATRVVPVSRLMPGLRRIVRTVSADLGKAVSFQVLNEAGTLDRDNHARCQIILEHMIRNALDHGIEDPQQRAAAGKDATGRITIDASKQGSDYIVSLSDDGRGIDPDLMRDIAHEKSLDVDVDGLSDDEALRLIFHKGFSTANALSEISGRGVGMDIVLNELQQIGGDIEIVSTVGVGTTFRVRIPSNITVNGALLVTAGEVSYAIPLDGLIAVEHVPVADFYEAIEKGMKLSLFGMECDPAYLATICQGDTLPERVAWGATIPVIIAGNEQRYMAIAIDDVTQALELVIRTLGPQFSTIPGLAGGATTSDGQSIVALDLNALVASVAADDDAAVSLHTELDERMLVLVVDDSRTQRMVATNQFDTLGVETVTAENGLVAIDLLNTTHRLPDVILLDIEMPVKDGIQTLREIRNSPRYSHVPVIMVTSRTGAKHRSLAQAAGCNGYMGKPFNFSKLVEQIDGLTQQKFKLS